ncbi:hypothetical protein RCL1_006799 [Eukaryota sp. TZLM3-RCL]
MSKKPRPTVEGLRCSLCHELGHTKPRCIFKGILPELPPKRRVRSNHVGRNDFIPVEVAVSRFIEVAERYELVQAEGRVFNSPCWFAMLAPSPGRPPRVAFREYSKDVYLTSPATMIAEGCQRGAHETCSHLCHGNQNSI